jgi:hypothetical protein
MVFFFFNYLLDQKAVLHLRFLVYDRDNIYTQWFPDGKILLGTTSSTRARETDMPRPEFCTAVEHSSKELFRQLIVVITI